MAGWLQSQNDPATDIVAISPSDSGTLAGIRGICFGGSGALRVLTQDGSDITIPSGVLAAGVIHPIRVKRVFATGTSATSIYGVK
jgi:hypothetical protein